jgi:polyphenol oxidase
LRAEGRNAMATAAARKKSTPEIEVTQQDGGAKNAWKLRGAGGLKVLEAGALENLGWVVHGFSTRPGGGSKIPTDGARGGRKKPERALNLGFTDWDERDRVAENRRKFFGAIGAKKMRVVTLQQIHSDLIRRVDSMRPMDDALPGDAMFTRERGFLLAVQTADCIPVLLADRRRRAVAAIHSGWRGTVRRIAAKTLGRMQMEFGTSPGDVIAAFGPGIGGCCYEVGSDVVREFHAQFPKAREWFEGPFDALASGENDPNWLPWLTMAPPGHPPPPPRVQLDLIAANRSILMDAGVPAANIFSSEYCTYCRSDLFFSYRRERSTGRMLAAIGIG